jgi:hypothetical protein
VGSEFGAKCRKCGKEFRVRDGGGFVFHLLHCDRCGREKGVGFDELGELHFRYLKGLVAPYCVASAGRDKDIQENYPGKPISERWYHNRVEKFAGRCRCGGQYKFRAPARCPKCRSKDYDTSGRETICYD